MMAKSMHRNIGGGPRKQTFLHLLLHMHVVNLNRDQNKIFALIEIDAFKES